MSPLYSSITVSFPSNGRTTNVVPRVSSSFFGGERQDPGKEVGRRQFTVLLGIGKSSGSITRVLQYKQDLSPPPPKMHYVSYLNITVGENKAFNKCPPWNLQTNTKSYTTQTPRTVMPFSLLNRDNTHQKMQQTSQSLEYFAGLLLLSFVVPSEKQFKYDKNARR